MLYVIIKYAFAKLFILNIFDFILHKIAIEKKVQSFEQSSRKESQPYQRQITGLRGE